MDEMCGLHRPHGAADYAAEERGPAAALVIPPENLMMTGHHQQPLISQTASSSSLRNINQHQNRLPAYGSDELISVASAISEAASIGNRKIRRSDDGDVDVSSVIKAKIASHPHYPRLLQAYIDCQKVGAPPEIASLLDEIRLGNDKDDVVSSCLGADPELDEFMKTYCDVLIKYKSDLSRPFDEATDFLNKIETQLSNLSKGPISRSPSARETFSTLLACAL